jgi:phosphoribosylglycinamide formyltransferase 1
MKITRVALLVGSGSRVSAFLQNMQVLKEAEIALVLSCAGLNGEGIQVARMEYGLPAGCVCWSDYRKMRYGRELFSKRICRMLESYEADFVVMAGWRVLMPKSFMESWQGRVVNIHPSILPEFPGNGEEAIRKQWERRLGTKKKEWKGEIPPTGCTLHYIDEGMDTGSIILQGFVDAYAYETLEEFVQAIHKKEDEVLFEGVRTLL